MKGRLFQKALDQMQANGTPYFDKEARSFSMYHGKSKTSKPTPTYLSPQTHHELMPELIEHDTMVFRLGSSEKGKGTAFGLFCAPGGLNEYFLYDEDIFPTKEDLFIPQCSYAELLQFQLLGSPREAHAINLSVASGLMAHALQLSDPSPRVSPVTSHSAYSFDVWPHSSAPDLKWKHRKGQVEIDAIIVAQRERRWTAFVIEGKFGRHGTRTHDCLPKYKLVYACQALMTKATQIINNINIVPVYVRCWYDKAAKQLKYRVVECVMDLPQGGPVFVNTLQPQLDTARLLSLPITFFDSI